MAPEVDRLLALDVASIRSGMEQGSLKATQLTEAYLAQIEKCESDVQAFSWYDAEHARAQAAELDRYRSLGLPIGPLHGVPVAVKDIIDTADIPTENGCAADAGRVPTKDAYVIERLKAAGAVMIGKTVTAELAFMHPGKTRNPHNLAHTPGGSSQGSAAAVASAMAPLAIGTQTGGSVIRPASFCGVTGFKPTFGRIPRRGVLAQSPSLDTVGVFARTPLDAAALADALFGADAEDTTTRFMPPAKLFETAAQESPLPPVFALVRPPGWEQASEEVHEAFAELAEALGEQVFEVDLPSLFNEAAELRKRINYAEMARCYYPYWRKSAAALSSEVLAAIEEGNEILARDYIAALDVPKVLSAALEEIFGRCDAIICPAALGPAPEGLESTGDPLFNGLWTLTGHPAVTLPLLRSSNDLPMGVQLVGERGNDARLLRTANWLAHWSATE